MFQSNSTQQVTTLSRATCQTQININNNNNNTTHKTEQQRQTRQTQNKPSKHTKKTNDKHTQTNLNTLD